MAEYQLKMKEPRQPKPTTNVCGDCGKPINRGQLLCKECVEESQQDFSVLGTLAHA